MQVGGEEPSTERWVHMWAVSAPTGEGLLVEQHRI